ncbi:hypothetical protein Y1Q_0020255 [Alligator mississippiensis]|uniref:Uncharacterized protein n=1 Tax=Alligator mississippiensis TaxID=8496 RepID=A0A151PIH1_ALLMI|nr:hypothetical protein Y1Q_0020255 [Alligator mississippiensis]
MNVDLVTTGSPDCTMPQFHFGPFHETRERMGHMIKARERARKASHLDLQNSVDGETTTICDRDPETQ